MRPKNHLALLILLFSFNIHAAEVTCPATLKSSFEVPKGWGLERDSMELSFIGSSVIKGNFSCYYGVGRVALKQKLPKSNCRLKNSHKNPIGIPEGKVCNGMASDCALLCP